MFWFLSTNTNFAKAFWTPNACLVVLLIRPFTSVEFASFDCLYLIWKLGKAPKFSNTIDIFWRWCQRSSCIQNILTHPTMFLAASPQLIPRWFLSAKVFQESSEFSLDGTVFLFAPAEATWHVLCMLGTMWKARLCQRYVLFSFFVPSIPELWEIQKSADNSHAPHKWKRSGNNYSSDKIIWSDQIFHGGSLSSARWTVFSFTWAVFDASLPSKKYIQSKEFCPF